MAEKSTIEWTDATWNPVTGCSVVSPGCTNCYAMRLAGTRLAHHPSRQGLTRDTKAGPVWTGETRLNEAALDEPLRWRRPRRIFVCAHGDLFHESVPDAWIDKVFAVMALSPRHTFQVLTKRAARMLRYMTALRDGRYMTALRDGRAIYEEVCDVAIEKRLPVTLLAHPDQEPIAPPGERVLLGVWPLPNVWLGVSVEDQARADERIPPLLETPAAKRFISAEPLLGAVDLRKIEIWGRQVDALGGTVWIPGAGSINSETLRNRPRLDWVIVGGESGRGSRPMHPDWVRAIRDQCRAADVPFFFKQWGQWKPRFAVASLEHETAAQVAVTERHRVVDRDGNPNLDGPAAQIVMNLGKANAGATLDGREHREWPT